ncbi:MAG: 50S ribosomal protein L18 [Candidatus Paceibacterota bacterium]|jgi:large subunit ribosomal protein L18
MSTAPKTVKRQVRKNRIRAKVSGTPEMPRLSVFKSNKYIYAQLIDDTTGKTIAQASGKTLKKGSKGDQAVAVGGEIAKMGKEKGVTKVVFDRGGYIYTGRVRALADAAREGGLKF